MFNPAAARILIHPLKTALAALVAALACEAFGLSQPLWAVIPAIIVMQADLGGSVHAGWIRLSGTLIGALAGVLMGLLIPEQTTAMVLAVFFTLVLCTLIPGFGEAVRLAGITAAIVLLLDEPHQSVVQAGMLRFLETALGIAVALVVSFLVFPSRAATRLAKGLREALETCADLYCAVIQAEFQDKDSSRAIHQARKKLRALRESNTALIGFGYKEPRSKKRVKFLDGIFRLQQRMEEHLASMEHAVEYPIPALNLLRPQLEALAETTLAALSVLARATADPSAVVEMPPLAPVLKSVADRLQAIRRQSETLGFDLDDVIRFHALVTEMRYMARTVLELAGHLDASRDVHSRPPTAGETKKS
jgi:uncharacterized membrane protein YgaE (UPF0421/DUF939 family)